MKAREFPGALALGLLASLTAHTALFGGEHEMGGAYHAELVTVALAALGGFLAGFGALAWIGARHTADGSVLASRLFRRLPGIGPVLGATALWFALGERLEQGHAPAALWSTVAAIAAAAFLVLWLARAALRVLARAVIAVSGAAYADRLAIRLRIGAPVFVPAPAPSLRRRFARPPPAANDYRA
jgi:hypothetical protein